MTACFLIECINNHSKKRPLFIIPSRGNVALFSVISSPANVSRLHLNVPGREIRLRRKSLRVSLPFYTASAAVPVVPLRERVLTAEEQKALTPDMVIQNLQEGNKRFVSNTITARDHSVMVRNASQGQFPKAVILSCVDSRIPVEDVFDKGIGDLFVARVAGNFVNEDILGSMEFGCKVSGAKLILVLGHESCGAIKSAIDGVKLGNITSMLAKINPAVTQSQDFNGEKNTANASFVEYVAKNNVRHTIRSILQKSPILKEMADKGEIKIAGAYYDLRTGAVTFL